MDRRQPESDQRQAVLDSMFESADQSVQAVPGRQGDGQAQGRHGRRDGKRPAGPEAHPLRRPGREGIRPPGDRLTCGRASSAIVANL